MYTYTCKAGKHAQPMRKRASDWREAFKSSAECR